MDRSQPLVAGCHTAFSALLQMLKKESNHVRRDIDHRDLVDLFPCVLSDEWDQQTNGAPIAALRVPRQVALGHQVFKKETPYPRPKERISHLLPSGVAYRSKRTLASC